jgi:hypothetical protein
MVGGILIMSQGCSENFWIFNDAMPNIVDAQLTLIGSR